MRYFNLEYKYHYDSFHLISYYDNIVYLDCSYNNLTSLPELPNSLQILYCGSNQLSLLPELPNSLQHLSCNYNQLTKLPKLPNGLQILKCEYNQLVLLPELPNSLKLLSCRYNRYKLYNDKNGKKIGIIKIHPPLQNSKGLLSLCVYCETIQICKYNYLSKIFYM